MDDILNRLLREESDLQFSGFDEDTAWEIGNDLVNRAVAEKLSITIDITRGEHQVFHASRPGTSADNDEWVKRKTRLVYRFGHSSFYVGQLLKSMGKSLEEVFLIPEGVYAPHGGCFPIIVRGTGLVGTITVSGLAQEDDHKLVTEAIRDYMKKSE
ncbi:MAG TPA: heme-degrading domain-containing protein [Anaerolineales bacterium]|nr:heme-degrading domain-containing protein [Anaerolineales bacterium]